MGQPVKLSDGLVLDARLAGEVAERSIASQIEFWAAIGRAVEPVLRTERALELKQKGKARPLSECLMEVNTAKGRKRLERVLRRRPFPHYEPVADKPGYVLRVEEGGKKAVGRFVNRKFVVQKPRKK
jgi:hypothetical protein